MERVSDCKLVYRETYAIGDEKKGKWFSSASKLARFDGIALLTLSSNGKSKDLATKQGNRVSYAGTNRLWLKQVGKRVNIW